MTKREICERLIDLRDQLETGWQRNDVPARELCRDAVYDLRDLILDLAAPETEEQKEEKPKSADPPLLIYEENGEKVPCPVCGAPAAPIKNKPGVFLCKRCGGLGCEKEEAPRCPKCGDIASFTCGTPDEPDSFGRCYKCGVSFPLKRGEGEPKSGEGEK